MISSILSPMRRKPEAACEYVPVVRASGVTYKLDNGSDGYTACFDSNAGTVRHQRQHEDGRWATRRATRWARVPGMFERGVPLSQTYAGHHNIDWRSEPLRCDVCSAVAEIMVCDEGTLCPACSLRAAAPVPVGEVLAEYRGAEDLIHGFVAIEPDAQLVAVGPAWRFAAGRGNAYEGSLRVGYIAARRIPPMCLALTDDAAAPIRVYRGEGSLDWRRWWDVLPEGAA